jgi:hypothetical protein
MSTTLNVGVLTANISQVYADTNTNITSLNNRIDAVNATANAATNYSQYTNVSHLAINTTTMQVSNGFLSVVLSWFTGLFYQKSEIDSKETALNLSINNQIATESANNITQRNQIANETKQRIDNDTSLQNQITNINSTSNTSIATEITNRQNADNNLQTYINTNNATTIADNTTQRNQIANLTKNVLDNASAIETNKLTESNNNATQGALILARATNTALENNNSQLQTNPIIDYQHQQ